MKGNRAERTDYLLLHEFHQLKYICPDKLGFQKKNRVGVGGAGAGAGAGADGEANEGDNAPGPVRGKAKYSGGLVLEPKKGLYDSFILLLDFNSLYPSIIQEFNLCHTTLPEWGRAQEEMQRDADKSMVSAIKSLEGEKDGEGQGQGKEDGQTQTPKASAASDGRSGLPAIPDESVDRGVLPRVIATIVGRRKVVKGMIKRETDPVKKVELDLKQKALKLTANSMYGCLGFQHSRFYAQPIAALITAMGRETLQRAVDVAQETVGLEVIYGDTDSIMINTAITDVRKLNEVKQLGQKVKQEVNKLYKLLELEIDGIFRSMLLLKKKKYAAITTHEDKDGNVTYENELKGLDLVRRDWCIQSKDSGLYVLMDCIFSGLDREQVVNKIHAHLEEVATKMRRGELPLEKFIITKGLNKHPNEYPDGKTMPHVQVAKQMLANNQNVNKGDHIPYVVCKKTEEELEVDRARNNGVLPKAVASGADRCHHPEEVARSGGRLQIDVEFYLGNQILPPISRLCDPIEGTSSAIMAEKLGLDARRYAGNGSGGGTGDDDDLVDFNDNEQPDHVKFKDCKRLTVTCAACGQGGVFPGVFSVTKLPKGGHLRNNGLTCPNPKCISPDWWGESSSIGCYGRISNALTLALKDSVREYYDGTLRCDDLTCGLETKQLSVCGGVCLARGCNGKMNPKYSEQMLHTQIKYFDSLFDVERAMREFLDRQELQNKMSTAAAAAAAAGDNNNLLTKRDLTSLLQEQHRVVLRELKSVCEHGLNTSAYNWVSPGVFDVFDCQ